MVMYFHVPIPYFKLRIEKCREIRHIFSRQYRLACKSGRRCCNASGHPPIENGIEGSELCLVSNAALEFFVTMLPGSLFIIFTYAIGRDKRIQIFRPVFDASPNLHIG